MQWLRGMIAILALAVAISVIIEVRRHSRHPGTLPVYGRLDRFALRDQEGRLVTSESLRGAVHVINFIFTSCQDVCPMLTRQMGEIQRRTAEWGTRVKLLSISVDPRHDTPGALKAYGARHHADFSRWEFATGSLEEVRRVVVKGFLSALRETPQSVPDLVEISHGENFVIVDRHGQIRAFRHAQTEQDLELILQNVEQLL
jgi:protein SCO1/2